MNRAPNYDDPPAQIIASCWPLTQIMKNEDIGQHKKSASLPGRLAARRSPQVALLFPPHKNFEKSNGRLPDDVGMFVLLHLLEQGNFA